MNINTDIKSNERFEFKVYGEYEKPAIWFRLREKEVIIFPLPLLESLWDCNKRRCLCHGIEARFLIFKNKVFGYYYDETCGSYSIEYERDVYIDSALRALTVLCKHITEGNDTLYASFTNKMAEQMQIDLQQIVIPKNYSQIYYDKILIEDFSFRFIETYSYDTAYEIKIGNRAYITNLSDWTTNFNLIRNEIEMFYMIHGQIKQRYIYFMAHPI